MIYEMFVKLRNYSTIILLMFSLNIFADETKPTIAVLDLKAIEISRSDAIFMSSFLTQDLTRTGKFRVTDRVNIDKILIEQGFQQTGCTESECAVEIGKILNIKYAVVGNIGWLANKYMVAINIIDVETGEVVFATDFGVVKRDDIRNISRMLTKKIVNYLIEEKQVAVGATAYKTVPHMPKIKSMKNNELTIDRGKEAGIQKRQMYHIFDNDFNKIGKLRIEDSYYGGATAKILKVNKNSKLRAGLPLEYYGKRKIWGIGILGGIINNDIDDGSATFLYYEYIFLNGRGIQINLGGIVFGEYTEYHTYEEEGFYITRSEGKYRYSRRIPIIYKKYYNYDGLISTYFGVGLSLAEDVKKSGGYYRYPCSVFNFGIDLFSNRRTHCIMDIKYFPVLKTDFAFFYKENRSALVTSAGISFNW